MAIIALNQLQQSSGPLLGIDPGTKTLGLAISDQIIKRFKGRISVTSALGEGATFRIELPLPVLS